MTDRSNSDKSSSGLPERPIHTPFNCVACNHVRCTLPMQADSALPSQPAGERAMLQELVDACFDGANNCPVCLQYGVHKRDCALWKAKEFLAARSSSPEGEPTTKILSSQLWRCLERLHLAVNACARIGFEESSPTTNDHHASIWNDLNEAQKDAELKLKHFKGLSVAAAPSREPQAQGEGMPGPNGTCKLASNYAPSRHNGSHPQYEDCLRWKADTGLVGGLAAALSREWIKRAAKEICDKGYCGPYSFVEEILARHAAQQEEATCGDPESE